MASDKFLIFQIEISYNCLLLLANGGSRQRREAFVLSREAYNLHISNCHLFIFVRSTAYCSNDMMATCSFYLANSWLEIRCIGSSDCILVEARARLLDLAQIAALTPPHLKASRTAYTAIHSHTIDRNFYWPTNMDWLSVVPQLLLITYNFYFLLCLASLCPASTAPEAILPCVSRSCTYTTRSNFAFFSSECYNYISIALIPSDFRRKI